MSGTQTRRNFVEAMSKRGWVDLNNNIADALEVAGLAPWLAPAPQPTEARGPSDRKATLEELIAEINQPMWRAAAFARLDELRAARPVPPADLDDAAFRACLAWHDGKEDPGDREFFFRGTPQANEWRARWRRVAQACQMAPREGEIDREALGEVLRKQLLPHTYDREFPSSNVLGDIAEAVARADRAARRESEAGE